MLLLAQGVCAVNAARSGVSLTASVDRHTVPLDETAVLTVLAEWEGRGDRYRFGWPETPEVHRFSIVGSRRGNRSWVDDAGEHAQQEFAYILKPGELGKAAVGAVRLTYWDADDTARAGTTLMTLPITLDIVRPARSERRIPWRDLGVTVFVLGGIAVSVWWLRLRRSSRPEPAPEVTEAAELQEHLHRLSRIRTEGDASQFYDEAVVIVRMSLQRALDERLTGKGTDELIRLVEKTDWPDDEQASLIALLTKADRRRFAPARPEAWELAQDEAAIRKVCGLTDRSVATPASGAGEGNGDRSGD